MAHETRKKGALKNGPVAETEKEHKLDEYKVQCTKQTEVLVRETFPQKVIELNALLDTELFSLSRLPDLIPVLNIPVPAPLHLNNDITDVSEPSSKKRKAESADGDCDVPGCKVYALPNGSVPVNTKLVDVIDIVKPLTVQLINHANQVKMWISFMIPKIEDGNNFGVSIQEDTLAEARQIESDAATYLDQISRYFLTRGKIISKVAKYPHVEDYRRTIIELDEKEFISLRLVIMELRNHYAGLHDIIIKNLDKIKKPRSTNTDNMY